MISTILLRPHDPGERLLSPGAPVAYCTGKFWHYGWTAFCAVGRVVIYESAIDGDLPLVSDGTCLVLARDGAVVPEGEDRLKRMMGRPSSIDFVLWVMLARNSEQKSWTMAVERLRQFVAPFGTLLLLDANGAEVSDV